MTRSAPPAAPAPKLRQGRKRALQVGMVVAGVLGLSAALAPWTFSRGALREEIAAQIRLTSGLIAYTTGRSTFSLLPRPQVRLEQIALIDPSGSLIIRAKELRGVLRLGALLAGRLDMSEATLDEPALEIELEGKPMSSAGVAARVADIRQASPEAETADHARLGVVTFVNGSANLKRGGQTEELLSAINATLDWRIVSAPASLKGAAIWRGRPIGMAAWLTRPADLLRGESSNLTLQFKAPELDLNLNGPVNWAANRQFSGRLVAELPSTREFFELAGLQTPALLGRGSASIDGDCIINPAVASINNAKITIGQNQFQGAVTLRIDEWRPALSGTLATRNFSGLSALADMPALVGADRHFSRESFDPRPVGSLDVDLRLSANEARFGRLRAEDVAAAIYQQNGRFEISITEARIYKGLAKARLELTPHESGVKLKASAEAHGVDWGAVDWDQFGDASLSGTADLSLTLAAQGQSPDQLARNASGHGDIKIVNGEIIGLDIERILKRMDRRPLSTAADLRMGRTAFDLAHANLGIDNGRLTISEAAVEGSNFLMNVSGGAQLSERTLDLRADVIATKQQGAESPGFSFDIQGRWDNASLTPDAQSFIKRSGAARLLMTPRQPEPNPPLIPPPPFGDPTH